MGCTINRDNIESEMLILQLQKMKIKDEREAMIKLYEDITGEKYIRKKVPDYIDHKAMKEIKKLRNNGNSYFKLKIFYFDIINCINKFEFLIYLFFYDSFFVYNKCKNLLNL